MEGCFAGRGQTDYAPEMSVKTTAKLHWDFYSGIIILIFFMLQILRWRLLPQFMDTYYHLLTAWGFIQAGGYSEWDFWQYAPFGRPHIYPPLFGILTAFFIKTGIDRVILAKFYEVMMPVLFLSALWYFMRKNYSQRLALFVLIILSASFSFFLSLLNYLPATLAMIFGLFAADCLLNKQFLRAAILLALCFYTHIGVSWFFFFALLVFGLFAQPARKRAMIICGAAVLLAMPVLVRQWILIKEISLSGIDEKYFCEFKLTEYALALWSLAVIWRKDPKYRLFAGFFAASLVFLPYPYRFFSAQGYLPIIFLAALAVDFLWAKLGKIRFLKYALLIIAGYFLVFSPTLLMAGKDSGGKIGKKVYFGDSAVMGMALPLRNSRIASLSLWFPNDYLFLAKAIKDNSEKNDIVYSSYGLVGVIAAALSERATANGLLPEIRPRQGADPVAVSRLIIIPKDGSEAIAGRDISRYKLIKVGESDMFIVYKNLFCRGKIKVVPAAVSFRMLAAIMFGLAGLFLSAGRLDKIFRRKYV